MFLSPEHLFLCIAAAQPWEYVSKKSLTILEGQLDTKIEFGKRKKASIFTVWQFCNMSYFFC